MPLPQTTDPTIPGTPVTSSAPVGSVYTAPPTSTPATAYQGLNLGTYDNSIDKGLASSVATSGSYANTPVPTQDELFRQYRDYHQSETDAANRIFTENLRQAQTDKANAVGGVTAANAFHGLAGSSFGDTAAINTNADQNKRIAAVGDANTAKIAAIQNEARSQALADYTEKRNAQRLSTQDYLSYLGQQGDRRTKNADAVASSILAKGLTLDQISPAQLQDISSTYGISTSQLQNAYTQAQINRQKALLDQQKTVAETQKLETQDVRQGGRLFKIDPATGQYVEAGSNDVQLRNGTSAYRVDPTTGKYIQVANNPKTFSPRSTTGISPANLAAGEAKLNASKGPDGFVDPAVYQKALQDWPGTTAQFLSKYPPKDYVNPANKTLPTYLRPASKSGGARTL